MQVPVSETELVKEAAQIGERRRMSETASKLEYEARTPSLRELRRRFSRLHPTYHQHGLDDLVDANGGSAMPEGAPLCQGCLPEARLQEWLSALPASGSSEEEACFVAAASACASGNAADGLASAWAASLSSHNEYFVFEEGVRALLAAACRDKGSGLSPGTTAGHVGFLCGPICFISERGTERYIAFRRLFSRHMRRLVALTVDKEEGLLPLLRACDDLLQEGDPELAFHLRFIGLPAHLAGGEWVATAFAKVLPAREVLLLWDRVVGFDSLLPLPLMAAAMLFFYRWRLLECTSRVEASSVLSDIREVKVVPLIQHFLFPFS